MEDVTIREITEVFCTIFSAYYDSKTIFFKLTSGFQFEIGISCSWVSRELYLCYAILKFIHCVLLTCGWLYCLNLCISGASHLHISPRL